MLEDEDLLASCGAQWEGKHKPTVEEVAAKMEGKFKE